jgi:hypothetical protein
LQEFLLASDPLSGSSIPRPRLGGLDGSLEITYSLSAAALEDVHLWLESSTDLVNWRSIPEDQWSATWLDTGMVDLIVSPRADQDSNYVRIGVEPQ